MMRWLRRSSGLRLLLLLAVAGCGEAGGPGGEDALTLAFLRFDQSGIDQSDAVSPTSADVDVCISICSDLTAEPFTQTRANGVFINRGKADIVIDRYTVDVPGSGVPAVTRSISALVPGGRCSTNPTQPCAVDEECLTPQGRPGRCTHSETTVNVLLYDFEFKVRVRNGQCPGFELDENGDLVFIPGTVFPQTYDTRVTFSGESISGERFTVETSLAATFADFDNCEE